MNDRRAYLNWLRNLDDKELIQELLEFAGSASIPEALSQGGPPFLDRYIEQHPKRNEDDAQDEIERLQADIDHYKWAINRTFSALTAVVGAARAQEVLAFE